ncbi:MAG: adenosylcobinamide-phosphate synthase CbiB [Pseudomonadota bacterium]
MNFAAIILVALAIDALIGWPKPLFSAVGHPVTWIGGLIAALDRRWNTGAARRRVALGGTTVLVVLVCAVAPAVMVQNYLSGLQGGWLLLGTLAWPLIAARSLHEHVADVQKPLSKGNIEGARAEVAKIVGRDPKTLDTAGIARASVESLAENASDGVIAPMFWGAFAGLPGLVAYKAINTMDSMIGHRNERYEQFGKVAAVLDDLMNLIPARLTALLFAFVAGQRGGAAFFVTLQDAGKHRSPNAGWPEAAVAGALNIRLSGPRTYGDSVVDEPWVNDGAPDPGADDIAKALALYRRMVGLFALVLLVPAWL